MKAVIAVLGKPVWFGEDAGAASLYDLAMLAGMYGVFGGAMTAMGLLSRAAQREKRPGVGDGKVLPKVSALLKTTMQELLPLLDMLAKDMDKGSMEANGFPVETQRIALQNTLKECEEEGIDGRRLGYFTQLTERVCEEGRAQKGMGLVMRKIVEGKGVAR